MNRAETLVIGGGQAGLAMSRCLVDRGLDHVVLERGRVGERWRSERWESLRLLTPNWQSRLPGWSYRGADPDGFMTRDELVEYLEAYARSFDAPVVSGCRVVSVVREGLGYRVQTNLGAWRAANVVIATGNCDRPLVPAFAAKLSGELEQVTPSRYQRPAELPEGGVLVVGASATGIQLAEEIHRSGRPVTLAVGRHTRLPRVYRGRDIQWWLDAVGVWDQTVRDVQNIDDSRHEPSLQLIGSVERRTLDLGVLQDEGIRLVGRTLDADAGRVTLADDLPEVLAAADLRSAKLLHRIDAYIAREGLAPELPPPASMTRVDAPPSPRALDLGPAGIRTVLWATGYRRAYPWLRANVLDARGEIRHDGGVTAEPGLYVLGLQFLRTRKSSFLDGVGADAAYLAEHIATRGRTAHRAAA